MFASVVAFMGIGLVDPILKPIAEQPERVAAAGVAAVHRLYGGDGRRHAHHRRGGQPRRPETHPAARPGGDHRRRRPGRHVGDGDRNRWVAGALGSGQRAVRRDGTGDDRRLGARVGGARDHPVRGGTRTGHRRRAVGRRSPWLDLVAWTVLRCLGADGRRRRRHRLPAAVDATCRAGHHPGRSVPRAAAPGCSASRSLRCCTTSASSPCWRSRRSRST